MNKRFSIFGIGVESTFESDIGLREYRPLPPIRRLSTIWHHKQPLSGPKANFIGQPDTLGCSVFRCGASLMRLPRSPGKESVTANPMAKPLARIGPPLLKALLPKFHWLIIARLSKVNRYADALETGADGKTDLVDTYRGWAWLPRIGEMFLTMNLRMKPVRHGARTDISRSGVPTVYMIDIL